MMRRFTRHLIAALAGLLLLAAACGVETGGLGPGGGETDPTTPEGDAQIDLVIGTGSVGGPYDEVGGALARLWTSDLEGVQTTTLSTGASPDNLQLLHDGEIDLALSFNDLATDAALGRRTFDDNQLDFAFAGNVYPEAMHLIATRESGIESVEDLDGASIIGARGDSINALLVEWILDYADAEPGEWLEGSFYDAPRLFRDGEIDAAFAVLPGGDSTVTALAESVDVTLVELPDYTRFRLETSEPGLSTVTIPAGTYPGVDEDVVTVSLWTALYVPWDMDEDLVYELVRVLYAESDRLTTPIAEFVDVGHATDGLNDIEIHPGAARFHSGA